MTKICTQTEVPTTDNTAIPCNGLFEGTDCIIYKDAISYLSLQENSNMTEVITALLASLIDARNRIISLEERVLILETP